MKKSKFFIGLSAAFVAFTSLMSCGGIVRAKDHVILTIGDTEITAEELFGDMKVTEAAAKEMFDAVYRVAVRKYFASDDGKKYMDEITKDTKIKMSGQKDIAQSNADKNGTSYAEEWQKILDSNGVEDEDELYDKFEYEIEKDKFNEKFYEGNGEEDKNKNLEILRDGGKFGDDTPEEKDPELMKGYLKDKRPYHVRHILVKISAAKDDPCTGEITESEAKKLSDVITQLANGDDFARVARANSDDAGSKAKGGDLGIMDLDTSFVNEFKLGTYLYESFFSSATEKAGTDYCDESAKAGFGFDFSTGPEPKEGTAAYYVKKMIGKGDLKEAVKDPTNKGKEGNFMIGQIPYEAALALGKGDYGVTYNNSNAEIRKTAFADYDFSKLKERLGREPSKDVSDKPKYYPRNIIFNKYFNKNNIMVITPSTLHAANEIKGTKDTEGTGWGRNIVPITTEEHASKRTGDDDYTQITANTTFAKLEGFNKTEAKNDDQVLALFYGGKEETAPTVLRDNHGRVIFAFRSGTSSESSNEDTGYQGIHFVSIERSPFISQETYTPGDAQEEKVKVSRKDYFTEYYPGQTDGRHPTYKGTDGLDHDKITYPNYITTDEQIDKKARADDLKGKFKSYNPNIDTYVYRYLKNGYFEFTQEAKDLGIEEIIENWVDRQREDTTYQTEDKWNTTWRDYYYRLKQTTDARVPQNVGGEYKYGIVAEAAAFIYSGKEFDYNDITTYFGARGAFNE